jgi:hypothetical protein
MVADLHHLGGIDVLPDGQLLDGDDALGLVADVQEHLVAIDLDDRPFDEVAVLEVLEALLDGADELLRGQVVLGNGPVRFSFDPRSHSSGGVAGRGLRFRRTSTSTDVLGLVVEQNWTAPQRERQCSGARHSTSIT